jgi:DnaK suppressor protein
MRKRTSTAEASIVDTRHQELKTMLEERRREILDGIQANRQEVASDHDAKERRPDPSRMEGSGENVSLALWEMRAATVKQIDDALERLKAGGYGRCKDCGQEIEYRRLNALPFALRCRECQYAKEDEALKDLRSKKS